MLLKAEGKEVIMGLFLLGFFLVIGGAALLRVAFTIITTIIGTILGIGQGIFNVATGREIPDSELPVEERVRRANARIEAARQKQR
ncbi:MAG: hypothetical protein I3I97_01875 [Bifidobacterium thermophilum]|nr:hypothetical protein [Bifidobacterium thermophilum]